MGKLACLSDRNLNLSERLEDRGVILAPQKSRVFPTGNQGVNLRLGGLAFRYAATSSVDFNSRPRRVTKKRALAASGTRARNPALSSQPQASIKTRSTLSW
jgi:hypothetical protein